MDEDRPRGLEDEIAAMRKFAPEPGVEARIWQRLQEGGAATGEPVELGELRRATVVPIRRGWAAPAGVLAVALAAGLVAYLVGSKSDRRDIPVQGGVGVPSSTGLPSSVADAGGADATRAH
jgi:ferric-dicitrate binding protein FerR (iron transport regulator)